MSTIYVLHNRQRRCGMRRAGWACSGAGGCVRLPVLEDAGSSCGKNRRPGYAFAIVQLPPGATLRRTTRCSTNPRQRRKAGRLRRSDAVSGFSFIGQGENVGMASSSSSRGYARKITATEFIEKANGALFPIRVRRSSWPTCRR